MSQTVIHNYATALHQITCRLFTYTAPGATRRNRMKNLNLQERY